MIWMGRTTRWPWVALGGMALCAQGSEVMDRMYVKLAASFSATQALGQGGPWLLLARPGLPLTAGQTQDPYDLSRLLDQIPSLSRTYTPTASTYSSVYGSILKRSQFTREQNPAELNRIRDLKRLLFDPRRPGQPTPQYAAYLKARAIHAQATDARVLAITEHRYSGQPVPAALDTAVQWALGQWETLGHKRVIDNALATLAKPSLSNARLLFFDLDRDLRTMMRTDRHPRPWYPVVADPPIKDWLDNQGWMTWRFQTADLQAAAAGSTEQAGDHWPDLFNLTAQVKRVSITRPWLDAGIFHSHAWSLPKSGGFTTVSTGNVEDQEPGIMPLLVTGVLLAKEVLLTAVSGEASGHREAPKAFGPFALATPAQTQGLPLHPFVTSYGNALSVRVEGAQIIGFICELVPKAPTPDPKLFSNP